MKKFFQWLLPAAWFTIEQVNKVEIKNVDFSSFPKVDTNVFKVLEINEDEVLHKGLGMSDERAQEIATLVKKSIFACDNSVQSMALISEKINHANEFYFATVVLNKFVEEQQNPLRGLLAQALRNQGPDQNPQ